MNLLTCTESQFSKFEEEELKPCIFLKHARLSFYSNKPFQFILAVQTVCCSALCDDLNDPVEMQLRDYFENLARCVVVCNALIIMLAIYISGYFHSLTVRLAALMISIFNILQNNGRRIQGNVHHKGVERQSKWNSIMKMLKTKVDSRISWASLCAVRGERRDRRWPANRRGESSLKLCRVGSGCKVKPKSLLLSAGSMSALGREHSGSSSRSLWGLLPQPRDTAG